MHAPPTWMPRFGSRALLLTVVVLLALGHSQGRLTDFRALALGALGSGVKAGCETSLRESFGWFCENERAWARLKEGAEWQYGQNEGIDEQLWMHGGDFWQGNYEPEISCMHERMIGQPRDGGKWVCDPYRIIELSRQGVQCLVYSFGSNDDFSFEASVLDALPMCEVHTFDRTMVAEEVPKNVHFHPWDLSSVDDGQELKTLKTIMRDLGHDTGRESLEILKVDVEGSEFAAFNTQMEDKSMPFARQVLIELHPPELEITRRYFELMREIGYRIFSKEPDALQGGTIADFSFLLLNMTRLEKGMVARPT